MVVDLFFPRRCLGCGRDGKYICSDCFQKIGLPRQPVCPICGQRSILGATHACCLKPRSLNGLVVVSHYEGIIQKAIKKLKYKFVTDLADELVSLIIQMIKENERRFFPKFDSGWTLIPVPLHPRRQRWRGFNQAELLGKMIAQKMTWQFQANVLLREKYTQPQAEIKEKEKRSQNIRGVFKANSDSSFIIPDSKIILFDDVWTTGSTIKECAQVLKRKKAASVWALALAR